MSVNNNTGNYSRLRKKPAKLVQVSAQKERNLSIKKVSVILQKDESKRTKEEKELLFNYSEVVKEAAVRIERRQKLKERLKEIEDSEAVLDAKCKQLAEAVSKAEYLVVYTGAGISTAARIPDYRGTSGIWTLLQQGKDIGSHDLTQAEPTYTHMALSTLHHQGKLKHIVSQNCDGLHLRSGLPRKALSEVHGNMYIEVCRTCRPIVEYLRLFDVTENTARYSHKTYRRCYKCNSSIVDSIVHFGERGNLPWPLNWKGACKAAEKADMILCIGSSLKVLKRYPWLWGMDKPAKRRPQLYIVNLQWTPKDCQAVVKINGKCDEVMKKVMKYLSVDVPEYSRDKDPIFFHATHLCKEEQHTTNRPLLNNVKTEDIKQEIKDECDNDNPQENDDEELIKKLEKLESPVKTEIKTEILENEKKIVLDTGQPNPGQEELILITIKSGENLEDCCSSFKNNQNHDENCENFVDEKNDIPIIMGDDESYSEEGSNPGAVVLAGKNNFSISNILKNNLAPQLSPHALLLNQLHNLFPLQNTAQLLHNFPGSVFMNNFFNPNFHLSNLGLVMPLLQNFSMPNNALSIQDSRFKRTGEISTVDLPRKKIKTEERVETVVAAGNSSLILERRTRIRTNRNTSVLESSTKASPKKLDSSKCSFCFKQYSSNSCLFYVRREAGFKPDLPACECCGDDDEDEEDEVNDEDKVEKDEKAEKDEKEEKVTDEKNSEVQKPVLNPGWYGKGYKKHMRKKR